MGLELSNIDDDDNDKDENLVTKDEILKVLMLGTAESGLGSHGAGSKAALTQDLMEGVDKDMRKLKMLEENIRNRQIALRPGG